MPKTLRAPGIPLHSIEAEMSALGSMLYGEKPLEAVLGIVTAEDWYLPEHREIFIAIQNLACLSQPVDLVTLKQELVRRDRLEQAGGEEYLVRIAEFVPGPSNAAHYAEIVRDQATLRRLDASAVEIVKIVGDPDLDLSEKLSRAEAAVMAVGTRRLGRDFVPMKRLAAKVMDGVDRILDTGEAALGTPTGFYDLDDITTGLYGGDLLILAARPSMGKTALALSIALQVAEQSGPVAFFSLEMSATQLARRMASMLSKVSSSALKKPNLGPDKLRRIADACERLYNLDMHVDESGDVAPAEALGKCRRLKKERGLALVIVDYLQLMRGNRRTENRVQEISDIARSLKMIAKDLDVPVIALSQLSRAVENRDSRIPQLSDLRESGSIEAEADIVLMVYREQYYNERDPKWLAKHPEYDFGPDRVEQADIIVAKHRNGPTGVVKLGYQPTYALFLNWRGEG